MFEQMSKAGLARRLEAGADMIPNRHRHHGSLAIGMDDDAQAVFQRELLIGNIDGGNEAGERGWSRLSRWCSEGDRDWKGDDRQAQ